MIRTQEFINDMLDRVRGDLNSHLQTSDFTRAVNQSAGEGTNFSRGDVAIRTMEVISGAVNAENKAGRLSRSAELSNDLKSHAHALAVKIAPISDSEWNVARERETLAVARNITQQQTARSR